MNLVAVFSSIILINEASSLPGFRTGFLPGFQPSFLPGIHTGVSGHQSGIVPEILPELSSKLITDLVKSEWESFKQQNGVEYIDKTVEELKLRIFAVNKETIDIHNQLFEAGKSSFQLATNQFSDLGHEEFLSLMMLHNNSYPLLDESEANYVSSGIQVPDEIDWRKRGAVTEVKNQGRCGACWTFSTTGAIEGHLAIKTGNLISLSEQNLLDCSKDYGTNGCHGGWMRDAFKYVKANDGITSEDAYPYEQEMKTCRYNAQQRVASITGHIDLPSGNETLLKEAVGTIGPVTVAIDATNRHFQFYSRGIYQEPSCKTKNPSHAVLIVGYGSEHGQDYWLLKNSWGTTWGEKGFFKMARNKNNHCGIASWPSYPTV